MTAPYTYDPIAELLRILGSGAHELPAMRSTAPSPSQAHTLPATIATAHAPPMAHSLPAVRSYSPAGPMASPNGPDVGSLADLPVRVTPSAPQGAIGQMLQGLLATHPLNPANGPQSGLLAQQGPPDAPPQDVPPTPAMNAAPQAQRAPMIDRIHDWLANRMTPSAPQEYSGLLSPEEMAAARPGIAESIFRAPGTGTAGDAYRARLDHAIALKQMAGSIAENQRILSARRSIEARYPLPANPTDDQIRSNLAQRYDAFIGAGDGEMAKEIGASLRGILGAPKAEGASVVVGPGASLVDKKTGKALYEAAAIDKANDYTQYIDQHGNTQVLKKDQTPPPGWKPLSLDKTQITIDATGERASLARTDKAVKDYTAQIKPLRDRAAVIDQALKTIDDAAHNPNPNVRKTLYTSAVANFIQAADQKAQIRYQLLQYFKQNVDPSISGKWEILKSRLLNGTLPGYTMEGMLGHLQNLRVMLQSEMEQQRNGLIKRRPELSDALPQTSEFFPDQPTGGAPAASGGDAAALYDKYKLSPRKP